MGETVPLAPAVRVVDQRGRPVPGTEVSFDVRSGGGQVSFGTSVSGDDGVARIEYWRLGTRAGGQEVQATVYNLTPVLFSAEAVPGAPASMAVLQGDGQTGSVGSPLPTPPTIGVQDPFGNPVSGVQVNFSVIEGGGSLGASLSVTDEAGLARPLGWTLGPAPGPNVVSASLDGLSPLLIQATARPGLPDHLVVLAGDLQVGQVGTELPIRPAVAVVDRFGNPLPGIEVAFEVQSGGGSLTGSDATTNSSGIAEVGTWTLGDEAGSQSVLAQVEGLVGKTLRATASPGPVTEPTRISAGDQVGQVGASVPSPPVLVLFDALGNPVPGVLVTFRVTGFPGMEEDAGSVSPVVIRSDEFGRVEVAEWVLGTVPGSYTVSAWPSGLQNPVYFGAVAAAGPPSTVVVAEGDGQVAVVLEAVSVPPKVRVTDAYGNGVQGTSVVFSVASGGGAVSGGQAVTDPLGFAAVDAWTLGPVPGENRLVASIGGEVSVSFDAVGKKSAPASILPVMGMGQAVEVATAVMVPPTVLLTDEGGAPVVGAEVRFTITAGGGSLGGAVVQSGPDGQASVGSWILGSIAGQNSLVAEVGGLPPVGFNATGTPGPVTTMIVRSGDGQSGVVGSALPEYPSVLVRDGYSNRVPGVAIQFEVVAGGGSIQQGSQITGPDGIATAGPWTLGSTPGTNRVLAQTGSGASADFTAEASLPPGFDIGLVYSGVSSEHRWAFEAAVERWEEVIIGDVPDYSGVLPANSCQPADHSGSIDDIQIYVSVKAVDGLGGIGAWAFPCYYRTEGAPLPITAQITVDSADLPTILALGLLGDVILHEMGHALGIGHLWNKAPYSYLEGAGTSEPHFSGPWAIAAFDATGGSGHVGPKVPVENTGAFGTRDAHWRESVFGGELMSGFLQEAGQNPLSLITICSLADVGYTVDLEAADPYTVPTPGTSPSLVASQAPFHLLEPPGPPPLPAPGGG